MGKIIKDSELNEIKVQIQVEGSRVKELWDSLKKRVERYTKYPGIMQPDDTKEWWHIFVERIGEIAFVQAVEPSQNTGAWLRDVILDVCRKPVDEWIGPVYRKRVQTSSGPVGYLETSQLGIGIATAADLCPDLFTEEEHIEIKENLRIKSQIPCRNFLDLNFSEKKHLNNFFMVLLNGYGTISAYLDDQEAIKRTIEEYAFLTRMFNKDSYGEPVHYWSYATSHLSHLYDILIRYNPLLEEQLDISCYTNCIPWAVSAFFYMKHYEGWKDKEYPISVNFGDSPLFSRPLGDVLIRIANRAKNKMPKEAGLAKWLFEQTYPKDLLDPLDESELGFFNNYGLWAILLYPGSAKALSPEEANLPLVSWYENGSMFARDEWKDTKTILAIQGGYDNLNIISHSHNDQNSFVLSHRKELFFIDPGHCCYRLETQRISKSTAAHNTWRFEVKDEEQGKIIIDQESLHSSLFNPQPSKNIRLLAKAEGNIAINVSDAAAVYGEPIQKAERTWILAGANTLFIIDRIESLKPVKVIANFNLNNVDSNLKCNIAAQTKLVLRRSNAAMKFFLASSLEEERQNEAVLSTSWGYAHVSYHPMPNHKGQGREGSSMVVTYTSSEYKTSHMMVYAIAMDYEDRIKKWHILNKDKNTYYVEPPDKKGGYAVKTFSDGVVYIYDYYLNKTYKLENNDLTSIK